MYGMQNNALGILKTGFQRPAPRGGQAGAAQAPSHSSAQRSLRAVSVSVRSLTAFL